MKDCHVPSNFDERDSQKYTFGAIWSKKIDEDVKGNLISTGEEREGNYGRKHTKRNLKIRGGYSFVYGWYRGWYREKLDSGENKVHLRNWKGIQLFYLGRDTSGAKSLISREIFHRF